MNSTDPDGLFFKKLFKAIWKVLTSKWFIIAATVALTVISLGSSLGFWALQAANTSSVLGAPVTSAVLFGTHTTTLGWVAAGLSTALAIPTLGNWRSALQRTISFGIGQAVGALGNLAGLAGGMGPGGTPDWNPEGSDFARRRPVPPRRGGSGMIPWRPPVVRPHRRPNPYTPLSFRGLSQNRPLRELTPNEISQAFEGMPFTPTNHAIMRLRHPRTEALGIRTLNDYANSLNFGIKCRNITLNFDGTVTITHHRFQTVINQHGRIVTIKPE